MYGQNKVAEIEHRADGALNVNSLFYTIQGEGPDAGRPAIFLRLAKCNLRCHFCDTEFETGTLWSFRGVYDAVIDLASRHACNLLVITGGEPLLQNIVPLVRELNVASMKVSVESAGTVWVEGLEHLFAVDREWRGNLLVVSPKTPKINPKIEVVMGALKYIVKAGETDPEDGLPIMSTQLPGEGARIYRPSPIAKCTVPIYVQPCDENDPFANVANLKAAAETCMKHGYRLSYQLHKLCGLP